MKLFIKNMVSRLSQMVVDEELGKIGVGDVTVNVGVVEIPEGITLEQRAQLKQSLHKYGLELLEDKRVILIEKVKNIIISMIRYDDELPMVNYSHYISLKVGLDYTYIANIFSTVKGMTIREFIIAHKIERVKELILYDGLSLTEIAYRLNYSSVAHLSAQFKKVTGTCASAFRLLNVDTRVALEAI
jgi:YesN/AraC family two-component response regulator